MDMVSANNGMVNQGKYTYYAFISYQRKDEKWAKWLQRKLENYKLPVANAKGSSDKKSKYIRPVFRDKTDLTAGPLPDALKEALQQSRYLIVICSPNAVESPWVNEEIETFTKAGRTEYVIPFIVDGEPYSKDDAKECFPDAIKAIPKDKEPLGVNINESGKERAFIRTVAYMLNVKFDELWNRFDRHRRKIRNIIVACLAFLALLAFGIYDYTRTKVEYYADWVDVNGVPHGIIQLTSKQVSKKNNSYKFEYNRVPFGEHGAWSWRLKSVKFVNSVGSIIEPDLVRNRYSVMDIDYYKSSGDVSQIIYRNKQDKTLFSHRYTSPDENHIACVVDIIKSIEERGEGYAGSDMLGAQVSQENFSKINRYVFQRNNGLIIGQTFHHGNSYETDSTKTSDSNGIYGKQMLLDSLGRCIQIEYLNIYGKNVNDKQGISRVKYKYDKWSNIVQISYWGTDGRLRKCREGWAVKESESDENGNITIIKYLNEQELPCVESRGVSKCLNSYDSKGNIVCQSYFDTDGNPTKRTGGYSKVLRRYDKNGQMSEQWYMDEYDSLVNCRDNYAGAIVKCDENGNRTEIRYFNTCRELCLSKDSVAIIKQQFDDKGNLLQQTYFGVDESPKMCNADYAMLTNKYNEEGKRIEGVYYDTNGKIHTSSYYGYARLNNEYDKRGNWISVSYFDADGHSVLRKGLSAREEIKYNETGLVIEKKYYDADGNLNVKSDGYCKTTFEYDQHGNLVREAHFGLNNEPAICTYCKNASKVYKYDSKCNLIEESYYGVDGLPCNYKKGYHKIVYTYDSNGIKLNEKKYDVNGMEVESSANLMSLLNLLFN